MDLEKEWVLRTEEMFLREEELEEGSSWQHKVMHKEEILRKNEDFSNVYKKGKSLGEQYIVFFYRKNYKQINRVGFLASKKVGNSVLRNRARRLMKESYRNLKNNIITGYDMIFIARNKIVGCKQIDVEKSMKRALKRSELSIKKYEKN